ncbi:3-hydroxyacyl-ACP dehydratase FabZ [uncultured Microbacterium sp.]|uniref:3-hydroxyacyl-ACP dehydratase FabZ n=1 Tax=uncultured Microbacterium sp. TaxID=191216 RepID=UPI00345C0997
MTAADIMSRLPHRYPFLMVDRVDELVPGSSIAAIKNVTVNEPYFTGHFPGNPIMPGVMILEALAQAGGLLFDIGDRLCVLARIDMVRFRGVVRPGDRLTLTAEPLAHLASMGKVRATATVAERAVASADISYSFVEGGYA